jgi:hypothetical protein
MIRRNLFGFLAAAPVAFIGAAVAKSNEDDAPKAEIMRLQHGPQWERMSLLSGVGNEEKRQIGLAVGKDGFLWLKIGDDWRRVSVE